MNTSPVQARRMYRFRLADVICPDCGQMQQQMTADLEVAGEVVFLSDGGRKADCFAIIEVEGILSPLIVAVERLRPLSEARSEQIGEAAPNRRP